MRIVSMLPCRGTTCRGPALVVAITDVGYQTTLYCAGLYKSRVQRQFTILSPRDRGACLTWLIFGADLERLRLVDLTPGLESPSDAWFDQDC
jgi:hypothetical protein